MADILLPLLAFAAAAAVLTITPGADTAMVLRTSTADGPRAGVATALGICLGLLVWGVGAAFGLTALLAASALAFTALKWTGAAYLVYLGVRLLLRPRSAMAAGGAVAENPTGGLDHGDFGLNQSKIINVIDSKRLERVAGGKPLRTFPQPALSAFRRGLLTNLLNPKVGVFYISFLPQFIPHGVNVAAFSLLLAGVHVALSLAWLGLLVALTVPLARLLSRPGVVRGLDRLTACVFLGFGLKLALSEHP
ncbi:LysE family translocator [Phenylobacterium sp.]|uniref:LysE family translocator n=1 Tax=Phenylobacterium sp. TaxID=1871053 RepID=UPI002F414CF6